MAKNKKNSKKNTEKVQQPAEESIQTEELKEEAAEAEAASEKAETSEDSDKKSEENVSDASDNDEDEEDDEESKGSSKVKAAVICIAVICIFSFLGIRYLNDALVESSEPSIPKPAVQTKQISSNASVKNKTEQKSADAPAPAAKKDANTDLEYSESKDPSQINNLQNKDSEPAADDVISLQELHTDTDYIPKFIKYKNPVLMEDMYVSHCKFVILYLKAYGADVSDLEKYDKELEDKNSDKSLVSRNVKYTAKKLQEYFAPKVKSGKDAAVKKAEECLKEGNFGDAVLLYEEACGIKRKEIHRS